MDQGFGVADSSDWINTPFASLGPVESALRCQVCKDFFDTPMMTSCSHTFCSLCIRRCLSNDGKCPACRTADQELKLRRNWTVQELVDAFQSARPRIMGLGEELENARHKRHENNTQKRKLEETDTEKREEPDATKRKTRSQSRRPSMSPSKTSHGSDRLSGHVDDLLLDDGLAACPICDQKMKEEDVFLHLDTHNDENASLPTFGQESPAPSNPSSSKLTKDVHRSIPTKKAPERLPNLNYSILKDSALRRKFSEMGIPSWGPKALLIRRHTEWVTLWNANCDSLRPRTKRELLRELDIWERTQGGSALAAPGTAHGVGHVMSKDFDSAAWASSHDNNFQQLIAKARQTQSKPKLSSNRPMGGGSDGGDTDSDSSKNYQDSGSGTRPFSQSSFADNAVVEQKMPSLDSQATKIEKHDKLSS